MPERPTPKRARKVRKPSPRGKRRSTKLQPTDKRRGCDTPGISKEREGEYPEILDLAHDAILVMDLGGKVKFWNQGAEQLYGYRRQQVMGRSAHRLLRTEFPIPLNKIMDQVRQSGEWRGELVHRSRTGKRLVVASRWNGQFDRRGRLIGTFEINSDISEWKASEEERAELMRELQAAEERLRLAQRAASVWTWEYDLSSGEVERSEDVSALYGLPPGTLDNRFETAVGYIHPEDQPHAQEELQAALRDGEEHEMEYRIVRPDGRIAWISLRGRVHFEEGKPARVLGIGMDITPRKRAEEALRATEKLAATGRLAATIAHELNNPLAAVANLLYLIEMNEKSETQTKSYAKMALQELHRASNIVKQTLSFHRDSSTPVPVKISDLLDGLLALYLPRITAAHVSVEKRYEIEGEVRGFPGELRQVFSNLLINALEAMGRKGRLVLHIYPSKDIRKGALGVRVAIADSGPGIPDQARHQIFEPFFTTKGERGTGLGLWVTHGILQKHGGTIRVHSSTRRNRSGTVFLLFFPSNEQQTQGQRHRLEGSRQPMQLGLPLAG